ncbi:hypothetical protein [Cohnella hongkongensis]|uniref:Uncharacterized protein n=1 Tax=Cohnella hongkongensis TaxID=178337 RepID=A0ABV9F6A4_9BACL
MRMEMGMGMGMELELEMEMELEMEGERWRGARGDIRDRVIRFSQPKEWSAYLEFGIPEPMTDRGRGRHRIAQ